MNELHLMRDRGIRQYALLNLLRMHYINNEFEAARQVRSLTELYELHTKVPQLLNEAVDVSRTYLDKLTLQQCIRYVALYRLQDKSSIIQIAFFIDFQQRSRSITRIRNRLSTRSSLTSTHLIYCMMSENSFMKVTLVVSMPCFVGLLTNIAAGAAYESVLHQNH